MAYPSQQEIAKQESAGRTDRIERRVFNSSNGAKEDRYGVLDMAYRRGWDEAGPQVKTLPFQNPGY